MFQKLLLVVALFTGFACAQNRVYELRTYTVNEGKLDALKANFRDHNIELLKRHGIESIGYWVPKDPEKSKNTLIFMFAHPSMEAAKKNWQDFLSDPDFKKIAVASGNIVNHVDIVFLDPTDFSPLK